jgi:hypothetical protein
MYGPATGIATGQLLTVVPTAKASSFVSMKIPEQQHSRHLRGCERGRHRSRQILRQFYHDSRRPTPAPYAVLIHGFEVIGHAPVEQPTKR